MTYFELIQKNYALLTKSEKKVADFIISSGHNIVFRTMSDVKAGTHVGDATVVRFCQKIGFSGFSDFKIEVAKENVSQNNKTTSKIFYDENLNNLIAALNSTAELMKPQNLKKAVKLICEATGIYIFGVGGSGEMAEQFSSILLRVGIHSKAIKDPHFQAQSASLLNHNDLVIGFSLSGRTKDTYDSLKIAKNNHAKIIVITNYLLSPIATLGNIVLQTAIQEFLNGGSVAGRVSQLYVCDVLASGIEKYLDVDVLKLKEKVLRSIIDKSIE